MENSTILNQLNATFGESVLSVDETTDILTLIIEPKAIKAAITLLKEELGFIFLTDLCGIHIPELETELGVIYHLHNLMENKRIRLKTFVTKDAPQVDTLVDVFSAANWMERETFDFYGIDFVGHPNLKRILNVEYMDYHPLRKEFPLEDGTRIDKDDSYFGR